MSDEGRNQMTDAARTAQLEDAGRVTREEAELQLKVAANHTPSTPISLHRFKVLAESYLALLDSSERTIAELHHELWMVLDCLSAHCQMTDGLGRKDHPRESVASHELRSQLQREREVSDGLAAALKSSQPFVHVTEHAARLDVLDEIRAAIAQHVALRGV